MIILFFIINTFAAVLILDYRNIQKLSAQGMETSPKRRIVFPKLIHRLEKAGITTKADILFYIGIPLLLIPVGVITAVFLKLGGGLILIFTPAAISLYMLKMRKKKYDSIFQKNAYRIYKYVLNQISAGVRPVDALKNMHRVIEDKELLKVFSEACASYSISFDSTKLANDILKKIDTPESRNFAMSIKDGLFESRDEQLLDRLEQMMFNRYFAYVQKMTDSLKIRCLITVILLCAIIVCMILIPTVMDVQRALDSIFT